jgi:hypothetical protein
MASRLAQATMVATWLTELYLDQINRLLLEEAGEASPEYGVLVAQLHDFLRANVDVVDVGVTVNLLASYGRSDDLMEFATYRQARPLWIPAQSDPLPNPAPSHFAPARPIIASELRLDAPQSQ